MQEVSAKDYPLNELFSKYSENNQIILGQVLKAFNELNYIPSKKDSESIFDILKSRNTNYLTFDQFEFWWKELRSIGSQEYLVKAYVKLFKASKKIKEKLEKPNQQKNEIDINAQGTMIRIGFGKVQDNQEKMCKFRINLKNGLSSSEIKLKQPLRQQLELPTNDLALVFQIKLSEGIDQEKCGKDLQQLLKSIITVGTSLHKGLS